MIASWNKELLVRVSIISSSTMDLSSLREFLRHFSPTDFPCYSSQIRYWLFTIGSPYRAVMEWTVLTIMSIYLVRLCLIILTISIPENCPYLIFGNHLLLNNSARIIFNESFFTFFLVMLLFIISIYWYTIQLTFPKIWLTWYNLAVTNPEQFCKHNSDYLQSLYDSTPAWLGPLRTVLWCSRVMNRLWEGDPNITFGNDRLANLPGLTNRSRTRLLYRFYWTELSANMANLLQCKVFFA